jgi:transcription elongation factor GreA
MEQAIMAGQFSMAEFSNAMRAADPGAEATQITWLTPEGYASLQQELENLTLIKRPEIANRIRESQEHGEFSEDNNELDEVKFEQAIVESRIGELKTIFGAAQMLETDRIPTDHVGIGSFVKVRDDEFGDDFEVRVVASIEADPSRDLISQESPMGLALLGAEKGETVTFDTPDGTKSYKILSIRK